MTTSTLNWLRTPELLFERLLSQQWLSDMHLYNHVTSGFNTVLWFTSASGYCTARYQRLAWSRFLTDPSYNPAHKAVQGLVLDCEKRKMLHLISLNQNLSLFFFFLRQVKVYLAEVNSLVSHFTAWLNYLEIWWWGKKINSKRYFQSDYVMYRGIFRVFKPPEQWHPPVNFSDTWGRCLLMQHLIVWPFILKHPFLNNPKAAGLSLQLFYFSPLK